MPFATRNSSMAPSTPYQKKRWRSYTHDIEHIFVSLKPLIKCIRGKLGLLYSTRMNTLVEHRTLAAATILNLPTLAISMSSL
jgi:hypothetical protein